MPSVDHNAEVTLVVLVYRSLKWLDFVMDGVERSSNETRYRWLVVANDATEEVRSDPRVTIDWRNENPGEFYINRVYRAWNEGVRQALTPLVCMMNSDMYPSDYWLDQLVWVKRNHVNVVPTSLLVESGRIQSAMPEYVRDFGRDPESFRRKEFLDHAEDVKKPGMVENGRLYMPILVNRQEFFDMGAYPEGNPPGTTGDKDLFRRYADEGFRHVTALGSVCYHVQCGEQNWP